MKNIAGKSLCSRQGQIDLIKKLKLSYYDDVDEELKELYIDYY